MILEHWKYEIMQEKHGTDRGRWFVKELFINKGTFGNNVVARSIYSAKTKQDCLKFCEEHKIKI